jgi:hypothetical protein
MLNPPPTPLTLSWTLVEWVAPEADLALTPMVDDAGDDVLVTTVMTASLPAATGFGLIEIVVPGTELGVSVILPGAPDTTDVWSVYVVVSPALTVWDVGEALIEKSFAVPQS